MPNWCKGVLKVKGKKKDLLKFINEGIERYGYPQDKEYNYTNYPLNIETDEFGDLYLDETDNEHHSWLYFKDSRRLFVIKSVEWYWDSSDEEDLENEYIKCLDVKQAWNLEPEYLLEISSKYNIAFKIIGIESGCIFTQEIETSCDKLITNKVNKYEHDKDFQWEAYDPRLGG